ncbi:SDR family oxidoreductase [Dasania marina]|uniref:SDR family NAD(P)-dependent oxidoreductase n=1 Tax=Dasania marina TaxID=471499 RepID=UPI0030DBB369|tara:strand:- start:65213 stop:65914 length:702 start_codon:yes stop_codon:yes gene_type:complete
MKIKGKTIVISGASDGIGRSIALKLAKNKANLILLGRDEERLKKLKKQCDFSGVNTVTYAFDLRDDKIRNNVFDKICDSNEVDVLINNAGIWHKSDDITNISEEKIKEVIDVNLTSHILLTRRLLGGMRGREGTAIVNIISKSGLVPQSGEIVYTASKYGMKGFTDVLREDTCDDAVKISAVYQGGTSTGMFSKAGDDFQIDFMTEPDDIAELVAFMLSRPEKMWLKEVHVGN